MKHDDLLTYIEKRLSQKQRWGNNAFKRWTKIPSASSVLLLISGRNQSSENRMDPYLILNKRSSHVTQPGDLCCPGGGVAPYLDTPIADMLKFPFSPLSRWSYWQHLRKQNKSDALRLSLLAATCLREGFEEMRLNPLGVKFLGRLPVQKLVMFRREIYPFVGWVKHQKRFIPNREVDKIVRIPIDNLLLPENYACYALTMENPVNGDKKKVNSHYPCFLHWEGDKMELLWGATYRIIENFLYQVFDFTPPSLKTLPIVYGHLDGQYLTGDEKYTITRPLSA